MKLNRLRIGNVELRRTKYKDTPYEFVKWYPNTYYKQEEKMLSEGYTDTGHSLRKGNVSVSYSCFENPESCYVVAWLEKDKEGFYLQTVGDRLLDLPKEERDVLFEIYGRKIKRR
jgi:hypothetical protein